MATLLRPQQGPVAVNRGGSAGRKVAMGVSSAMAGRRQESPTGDYEEGDGAGSE
jgi:hypothetical protein